MNKQQRQSLDHLIQTFGFTDYQWIKPSDIVVAQWVRMKCLFGCEDCGHPGCPPFVPSITECREFINEYQNAVLLHFQKHVDIYEYPKQWAKQLNWKLLALEKRIFTEGYHKAFMLPATSCNLCDNCKVDKDKCIHKESLRPTPEAVGINVFETVRKYNYPIEVLTAESRTMNRYAFLLVE